MNNGSKNQHTFTVKYRDDGGNVIDGTFTTKRASIKDRSRIGMRKSQLAGGMYCVRDDEGTPTGQGLDDETDYLNTIIAHLEVALIQKPAWFNLDEITDTGLLHEVYGKVLDFESKFFRTANGKGTAQPGSVGEGSGNPEPAQAGHGNTPTPVVDKEVQAALDA